MSNAIDLQHLGKYVGDDAALRDEVLTLFAEQAGQLLKKLDPEADDPAWREAAHTLKGSARGVGAWAVGELAEQAERLVGDCADKDNQRKALREELRDRLRAVSEAARHLSA